ncbi:MAG: choice-of-anchor D domain-containing protein [Verrucomicrobiota bacterium]
MQFPDDPATTAADPVTFPTTLAKMDDYCNKVGYTEDGNIGSIRDYFYDQSNHFLTVTQKVTSVVTLPHPRNWYNCADYPTNATLYNNGTTGTMLLTDAVAALKATGFDFSTLSVESVSGFDRVIATSLLFAGGDSGVWGKGLWAYAGSVPTPIPVGTPASPRSIMNYQMTNVADAAPGIGTVCHELSHLLLKYPDLYDTDNTDGASAGVGSHSLMGVGDLLNNEKSPAPIDIYLKDLCGWATITDLTPATVLAAVLPSTGNVGYRIRKPGSSTEFFLIENRGPGDKWAAACPDIGIAVWHVDEAVTTANEHQQMTLAQHYLVSLVQADGQNHLEHDSNTGGGGDLFDTTKGILNNGTSPNVNWWDGTASDISIVVSSAPGASMNVSFGLAPPTLAVAATQSVLAAGATIDCTVTSNTTWSWSDDAAWVTSSEAVSQTGTQVLTYTVAPNTSVIPRTAVITLSVPGGLTATHTITQGGLILPDLVSYPGTWQTVDQAIVKPGGTFNMGCNVQNVGTAASPPYRVKFYLSTDTTISTADYCIGFIDMPALAMGGSTSTNQVQVTVPAMPAGTYYAGWIFDPDNLVVEVDESNNTGYVPGSTVIVDTASPTVAITSPASGTTVTDSPTLAVSGTVTDNVGVRSVTYCVASYVKSDDLAATLTTVNGNTTWTGSVTLTPGSNTIYALCVDMAGNSSVQVTRTVTYTPPYSTVPTVAITSPAFTYSTLSPNDTIYVNTTSLAVQGTATDDVSVTSVGYWQNNGTSTVWNLATCATPGTPNTTWSATISGLVPGRNYIQVKVSDPTQWAVYNVVYHLRYIWMDATLPTAAVTLPASDGSVVNNSSLNIGGTAYDNLILAAVYWRSNGGAWTLASSTSPDNMNRSWSATASLVSGSNTIDIKSQDKAGNESAIVTRTVTMDTTLPTVAFTTPASNGTTVYNSSLPLGGTAADNLSVSAVKWRINGGAWTVASGTSSWSATATLVVGSNTIEIQALDTAGNASVSMSRTVTYAVPEIAVEDALGANLTDNAATIDLGSVNRGSTSNAYTFTVKNLGTADLTGLAVTKAGTNPGDFTVGALGATTLAPGASTSFIVNFSPAATGTRSAAIDITSSDADENPFDINLTGTGVAVPEIVVQQPANSSLVYGSASIDLGSVNVGSPSSACVFTVKNLGTADLTGLAVTKSGANAADFTLGALGSPTLAPNASTSFTVTFTPGAAGSRVAAIAIASNDGDKSPFAIALAGTGVAVAAPEIVVVKPDATNFPATGATFDLGSINFESTSDACTFTVKNLGTADLTGLAVTKGGDNAGDFTLGSLGTTTLTPGTSAALTVTFAPAASGTRRATLSIASNDADKTPFTITLTGTGVFTAMQTWRNTKFGDPSKNGAGADLIDTDKDGLVNLVEYAFGLNPQLGDVALLPRPQKVGANLVISFTPPAGVSGISYSAESSTTLLPGSWTPVTDTGTSPQHTFSVPTASKTKLFMRLKVSNP